jgi:hypothetical protein
MGKHVSSQSKFTIQHLLSSFLPNVSNFACLFLSVTNFTYENNFGFWFAMLMDLTLHF